MVFEARGFHQFGTDILMDIVSGAMKYEANPYIPDFTVQANTDCLLMLITRRRYTAAYRASVFQRKQVASSEGDIERKEVEVFREEWQEAENNDLESSSSGKSGLVAITKLLQTKPFQSMSNKRLLSSPSMSQMGGVIQASPRGKLSSMTTPQRHFGRRASPTGANNVLQGPPPSAEQSLENQSTVTMCITLEEEEDEETEEEDVLKTEKERLLKKGEDTEGSNTSSASCTASPQRDNSRTSPSTSRSETKL